MNDEIGFSASLEMRRTLEIDRNFAYWLTHVNYLYDRRASEIYDRVGGLTTTHWRVTALLAKLGPIQAADLARSSTLDEGAISRAAKSLRTRGIVDRELEESDARRINLFLTDKGFALYREIKRQTQDLQQVLFAGVRSDDLRTFFDILKQLEIRLLNMNTPTDFDN